MRIFIPTWNRPDTISTHRLFPAADTTVLVHNEQQRTLYERCGVPSPLLHVTGVAHGPGGLTRQREAALRLFCTPGEWIVFADDNIRALTGLLPPWYQQDETDVEANAASTALWRTRYRHVYTADEFMSLVVPDCIAKAESVGAHMVGFSLTDNPLHRRKKWRTQSYAIGKLMLWKYDPAFPFDHSITMEDFYHTAEHLYRYGALVVNAAVWPKAGHYEPGGLGRYEERVPHRLHDVLELLQRYPGLFRVKDRKGFVSGTDLQLKLTGAERLKAWRHAMAIRRNDVSTRED